MLCSRGEKNYLAGTHTGKYGINLKLKPTSQKPLYCPTSSPSPLSVDEEGGQGSLALFSP